MTGDLPALAIPAEAVPAEVQHAAYRTVQEALANVRKHAPGAETRVLVRREGPELLVEVRKPPGGRPVSLLPSGGHGLEGLRERAAHLGGHFTAERAEDGGFLVRARLPAAGAAEAACDPAGRAGAAGAGRPHRRRRRTGGPRYCRVRSAGRGPDPPG